MSLPPLPDGFFRLSLMMWHALHATGPTRTCPPGTSQPGRAAACSVESIQEHPARPTCCQGKPSDTTKPIPLAIDAFDFVPWRAHHRWTHVLACASGIGVRGAPPRGASRKVLLLEGRHPHQQQAAYLEPAPTYTPPHETPGTGPWCLKGAGQIIHGPLNNHGSSTSQPAGQLRATDPCLNWPPGQTRSTRQSHISHRRTKAAGHGLQLHRQRAPTAP